MAVFSAVLKRGATSYVLTVIEEFVPASLAADVSIVGGTGTADPRLVRETVGKTTEMTIPLLLAESSQEDLVAEVDALNAFLRLGACTLEITFTDATAATVWKVHYGQAVQPLFSRSADIAHYGNAALELVVSPFIVEASVTLYDAEPVTAPCSLDLSAMTGNFKAPLTVDCDATSSDTHSLYLALDPTSFDSYLSDAVDLTWDAGATDTEDADARTGDGVYVGSVTAVTASIDTASYPEGPYLLLARVKVLNGETGYVTTDYTTDVIEFTRATWHTVELGRCYLPTRKVRGSAAANLVVSVYGSSASAGDEACIDWVYALPLGDGAFIYHPASDTEDATTIGRDAATGITYIDDVADEENVTGVTLMALGGTLLIVAEDAGGDDPEQALDVTVEYEPRFGWMR